MQRDEINPVHSSVKAAFPIASIEKFTGSRMDGEIDTQDRVEHSAFDTLAEPSSHIIVQLLNVR